MKQKFKKIVLFAMILTVSFCGIFNVYSVTSDDTMNEDGASVSIDLNDFSEVILKDSQEEMQRLGTSGITCMLSGNTGGIDNLYTIYIRWYGDEQIANISGDSMKISTTNNSNTYYDNDFFFSCGATCSGNQSIGTCIIPTNVKTVRAKTTKLRAYFNSASMWIQSGEINKIFSVNG